MALSAAGFRLVELRDGLHTLRDLATGETFHPIVGPMAEAETIHLAPLDLENRLRPDALFTVWDVGFGAAANAIALLEKLQAWPGRFQCELISFDQTLAPFLFALENAGALKYPLPWREHLLELAERKHVVLNFANGGRVDWRLCLGDFTELPSAPVPDAVIYDPYSPRKNLAMWSLGHFSKLRQCLAKPAILTSYSRSTAVRVTLLLAGFYVGVGSATGEKEETTLAATDLKLLRNPLHSLWLDRVRLSTSSRPLGIGETGPIERADLEKLEQHPQFKT